MGRLVEVVMIIRPMSMRVMTTAASRCTIRPDVGHLDLVPLLVSQNSERVYNQSGL
jgi:hypothetical protein